MTTDQTAALDLDPDAPHSPERTRRIADTAAEAVRALNYATLPGQGGLTYPGDAYDLLAALGTLAERLPQLCQQVARWLTDEQRAGHLVEGAHGPCGGSDALAVAHTADALTRAAWSAVVLRGMLGRAQSDISAVSYAGPDDDQDDADAGWTCGAGASLIAEATSPGRGRLPHVHAVIYVCQAHRAAAEQRITAAGYRPGVDPAPASHHYDPWPCGHITAYETDAADRLTAAAASAASDPLRGPIATVVTAALYAPRYNLDGSPIDGASC